MLWSIFNVDPLICRTSQKPNFNSCSENGDVVKCGEIVAFRYGKGWIVYAEGESRKLLKKMNCVQLPYLDITSVAFIVALGFVAGLIIDKIVEIRSSRSAS